MIAIVTANAHIAERYARARGLRRSEWTYASRPYHVQGRNARDVVVVHPTTLPNFSPADFDRMLRTLDVVRALPGRPNPEVDFEGSVE